VKSPINKLILILLVTATFFGNSLAHENHGITGEVVIVYDVIQSNNATNIWYDSVSNFTRLYHIENETQMELVVEDVEDPQSVVSFEIGNLTISRVPDKDAEEVFSYGYWQVPATFGFVANKTWTSTKFEMDKIEFQSLNFSFPHLNYLGGIVDTTLIEFKDIFQTTQLIYDQTSGILLEAHSEVFGFQLSLIIHSINGDTEYHSVSSTISQTSDELQFSNLLIILNSIFIIVIIKTKLR
jgi:hypothetical protein